VKQQDVKPAFGECICTTCTLVMATDEHILRTATTHIYEWSIHTIQWRH